MIRMFQLLWQVIGYPALLVLLSLSPATAGESTEFEIIGVKGDDLIVNVEAGKSLAEGAQVEFIWNLDGMQIDSGKGRVRQVNEGSALLEVLEGEPSVGMIARIAASPAPDAADATPPSSAEPDTSPPAVVEATPSMKEPSPYALLLRQCDEHFRENRLTTGSPGTAFACYRKALDIEPGNAIALDGIDRIAGQYVTWAAEAIERGQWEKAEDYLAKLQLVMADHPRRTELEQAVEADRQGDFVPESSGNVQRMESPEPLPEPTEQAENAADPLPPIEENHNREPDRTENPPSKALASEEAAADAGGTKTVDGSAATPPQQGVEEPDGLPVGLVIDPASWSSQDIVSKGKAVSWFSLGWSTQADKDFEDAHKWYLRSANLGYARAQFRMGWLYENGLGVEQSAAAARQWYEYAAEQGHEPSMLGLTRLDGAGGS